MGTMRWQPAWWNEAHANAWERVKEAMRRDWEQTKHDLHLKGGHELNQAMADTVKQAAGKEPMPPIDRANPPKVIGEWNDDELPLEYGYSARNHYGPDRNWSEEMERALRREWEAGRAPSRRGWDEVRDAVRHGYESKH
jgi:hypothetical protein